MSDIEIEEYYKREAKDLVDMLFDKRFLNDELSRESINWLEDYLGFILQTKCEMSAKCALLTAKMRDK
jgi:hypothetical protein